MYSEKPNPLGPIISTIAGLFFGLGWWIFFDAFYLMDQLDVLTWYHFLPILLTTLGSLLLIPLPRSAITGSKPAMFGDNNTSPQRAFLFLALILCFSGFGIACILAGTSYDKARPKMKDVLLGEISGNLPLGWMCGAVGLVCLGGLLFKFGRPMSSGSEDFF